MQTPGVLHVSLEGGGLSWMRTAGLDSAIVEL